MKIALYLTLALLPFVAPGTLQAQEPAPTVEEIRETIKYLIELKASRQIIAQLEKTVSQQDELAKQRQQLFDERIAFEAQKHETTKKELGLVTEQRDFYNKAWREALAKPSTACKVVHGILTLGLWRCPPVPYKGALPTP